MRCKINHSPGTFLVHIQMTQFLCVAVLMLNPRKMKQELIKPPILLKMEFHVASSMTMTI